MHARRRAPYRLKGFFQSQHQPYRIGLRASNAISGSNFGQPRRWPPPESGAIIRTFEMASPARRNHAL
jgi:hypothetical protein